MRGIYNNDPVPLDPDGKIRALIDKSFIDKTVYKAKLNVGCGTDYLAGFTNLDGDVNIRADVYCELDDENVRLPFEDETFDYIYASHILEHIIYLPQLKAELIRILKPSGVLIVVVPHMLSPDAWGDDTHCRAFSPASFSRAFWKGCNIVRSQELNIKGANGNVDKVWIAGVMQKERAVKTTDHCSDCGWCCYYSNFPVPTAADMFTLDSMLELYYVQGHSIYWEPQNKKWYVLMKAPCQHYDVLTKQCDLYGTGKRPRICRSYICPEPGNMWQRHEILCAAAQKILAAKFKRGGEK